MKKRFIPNRQKDKLSKGVQMYGVLSKTGVDPEHYGLTAADVTKLGAVLATAQQTHAAREDIIEAKKGITNAFSGPGQALDQLVAQVEDCGNKMRVSDATDDEVLAAGADRRKASPSPKVVPAEEPELSLISVQPGIINYRLHAKGSASVRARPGNAIGAQIALVDASGPLAAEEADKAAYQFTPRNLGKLDSRKLPAQVRMYARWQTQRGLVSPWSAPVLVKVL